LSFLKNTQFCKGLIFYVVLSCLVVLPANAAEYIITPSITARETYDDNVFFINVDDFEHLVSPALNIEARTERGKIQAYSKGDISEYQRHDNLNTVDQTYRLSADMFTTPASQVGISGSYIRDYTFTSTLEEFGVVAQRSIRKSAQIQPFAKIELNPRNNIECFYRLNKTQYRLATYPDNRNQDLNIIYIHNLDNEMTSLVFQLGGSQSDYTIGNGTGKHQGLQILAGIDHNIAETFKLMLRAGARYIESDFPGIKKQKDETFVANSGFLWKFERSTVSANISRDLAPSIYGEDMTRDRVSASVSYRITEKLNCAMSAAYTQSETEGYYQKRKNNYYSARPSVDYRFNEYVGMQIGCSYNRTENKNTRNAEDRNRVFLQIDIAYPSYY